MKSNAPRRAPASRITFARDELGFIRSIRSDEEVEIYIVCPTARMDRVYRWSSTVVGREHVDEQLESCIKAPPLLSRHRNSAG